MRSFFRPAPLILAILALLGSKSADAAERDANLAAAQTKAAEVAAKARGLAALKTLNLGKDYKIPARIASAELSYQARDYDRAIDLLESVVALHEMGRASDTALADALTLLVEAYYASDQFLSSRRQCRRILSYLGQNSFDGHAGVALARLVDIAVKIDDPAGLSEVLRLAPLVARRDPNGWAHYAAAKAHIALGDSAGAIAEAKLVPAKSSRHLQALYIEASAELSEGLKRAKKEQAIEKALAGHIQPALKLFEQLAAKKTTVEADKRVIELAWMASARLFYEIGELDKSIQAYQRVSKDSFQYGEMLYELAWAYIRKQDYAQAERALELLTITRSRGVEGDEGALLRGDLLLRSDRFEEAVEVYESIKVRYEPTRQILKRMMKSSQDAATYYDWLIDPSKAIGGEYELPDEVMRWVRRKADRERVFPLVDDVAGSRALIRRSRELSEQLYSVLNSPSKARAVPAIKNRLLEIDGLLNAIADGRRQLGHGLDQLQIPAANKAAQNSRRLRVKAEEKIDELPQTPGDFSRREQQELRRWTTVSQTLQELSVEIDHLQAFVNGIRWIIAQAESAGGQADHDKISRLRAEAAESEKDLQEYRAKMSKYREALEAGRSRVGYGDASFLQDRATRDGYASAIKAEFRALGDGLILSPSDRKYYSQTQKLEQEFETVEAALQSMESSLLTLLEEETESMLESVRRERGLIEEFADQLDGLDQSARMLVGELALRNFNSLASRLKQIVVRADSGIVQTSWEGRERQLEKYRNLQRTRARELQLLNDELREVLDDAQETEE